MSETTETQADEKFKPSGTTAKEETKKKPKPKVSAKPRKGSSTKKRQIRVYRVAQIKGTVGKYRIFSVDENHNRTHKEVGLGEARQAAKKNGLTIVHQ